MSNISFELRRTVEARAKGRCEYCGLSQEGQEATFHIDHIIPSSSGGRTEPDNLALACVSCSLRKAARQSAIDTVSEEEVHLFSPRHDSWIEHFRWDGVRVVGITPIGRATCDALQMNRRIILAIREEETFLGRHPHVQV